ncbi:carotenoid isomerooxygenase-like [Tribolium madens]|uniref:carotenoid isomerooxygenase-like n=1 Tax=Tribolium madens TaxID=41895 RepID=UPI001CF7462F|nr:carotenoid isomerooxygenase-like [Tribolium madens]
MSEPLYPHYDITVWLRSCTREIPEPITGTITGTIPPWLQGSLIRNGPGSIKVGDEQYGHLFDSSALLHRFNIESGAITYQCRFVQSEVFKRNRAANRIVFTEFGTKAVPDPCKTIFDRVAAIFRPNDHPDNSMISVYPFEDELYAFGEMPIIHKIDQVSLETIDRVNVSDFVSIVHHTSHPHVMNDGTVFNLALTTYPTGSYHSIVKFPPKFGKKSMFEQAEIVAGIPVRWNLHPTYMHSFGITENYFILVEHPFSMSVSAMVANKIKDEPLAGSFRWYQHEKTRISLISRKSGKLSHRFYSQTFFFFHIINQYEVGDYVIIDICTYRDAAPLEGMYIEAMQNMQHNPNYAEMFRSKPLRFVLPLNPTKTKTNLIQLELTHAEAYYQPDGTILLKPEQIIDQGCETPRINYNHSGKQYRYFYAISADVDSANPGTIIKVDTTLKICKTWCEDNCYPSEPIFVPRPNGQSEDDGVVVAVLLWGKGVTNRVGLVVLDGRDMTELGRAEFETPGEVPRCLHGWFLPK